MALYVHHGPRLVDLATGLVERLAAPTGDPFERARRRRADGRGTRLADPPSRHRPRRCRQRGDAVSGTLLRHCRRIRRGGRPVERRATHLGGSRRARRGRRRRPWTGAPTKQPAPPVDLPRRSGSPSPGESPTSSIATPPPGRRFCVSGTVGCVATARCGSRPWVDRANRATTSRSAGCRPRCVGNSSCGGVCAS